MDTIKLLVLVVGFFLIPNLTHASEPKKRKANWDHTERSAKKLRTMEGRELFAAAIDAASALDFCDSESSITQESDDKIEGEKDGGEVARIIKQFEKALKKLKNSKKIHAYHYLWFAWFLVSQDALERELFCQQIYNLFEIYRADDSKYQLPLNQVDPYKSYPEKGAIFPFDKWLDRLLEDFKSILDQDKVDAFYKKKESLTP